jgi:hypothetical protein
LYRYVAALAFNAEVRLYKLNPVVDPWLESAWFQP